MKCTSSFGTGGGFLRWRNYSAKMITTELKVKIRRTGTWGEVRGSGEVVGMLGEIVRICWNLTAARCHRVAISLSHSFGTALCTLAPPGFTFGCDLETVEPPERCLRRRLLHGRRKQSDRAVSQATASSTAGSALECKGKRSKGATSGALV